MPYLGNAPAEAYTSTVKNSFNGDGSTTDFTLSQPSTTNNLRVVVENVVQDPAVAYNVVNGSTLRFTSAPPVGTANIYAVHLGPATQTAVPPSEINNATTYTSDLTVQGDLTVDTDTLYVDAANNRVGVGTTSPSRQLSIIDSTNPFLQLALSTDAAANNGLEIVMDANGAYFQNRENTPTIFSTNNTEAARIDSSQRLLVGKTSGGSISTFGNELSNVGYAMHSRSGGPGLYVGRAVSTGDLVAFYYGSSTPSTYRGSISTNGSSISYNTTSDRRLKENVTDLTGAIDRVKQANVHRFNFIENPDLTVDGFIADEIQTVVPEAVTGTQDEVDEDGNPVYQCIDQSKLVPLLTAALQEAVAKIEALEARVATLENA